MVCYELVLVSVCIFGVNCLLIFNGLFGNMWIEVNNGFFIDFYLLGLLFSWEVDLWGCVCNFVNVVLFDVEVAV